MDSGEELGVDLHALWLCATQDLPEIAERWAGANQELHAHGADSGAFNRQEPVPGVTVAGRRLNSTSVGRVYPYFDQLRDELQNVMAESARNVYDTADALIKIVNSYAASDGVAGDRFRKLVQADGTEARPRLDTYPAR